MAYVANITGDKSVQEHLKELQIMQFNEEQEILRMKEARNFRHLKIVLGVVAAVLLGGSLTMIAIQDSQLTDTQRAALERQLH